jgi:pyridoxine 5-phosphate synthase
MAATVEMIEFACRLRPAMATLVPEGRMEVTTEGGLDVMGHRAAITEAVAKLHEAGVRASAFIDAEAGQIDAAAGAGFVTCEIHTGPYAIACHGAGTDPNEPAVRAQLDKVTDAAGRIVAAGMTFNAGHGLNYVNVGPIAGLPSLDQLHIGHAIISRAVFVGLEAAVAEMKRRIDGK